MDIFIYQVLLQSVNYFDLYQIYSVFVLNNIFEFGIIVVENMRFESQTRDESQPLQSTKSCERNIVNIVLYVITMCIHRR